MVTETTCRPCATPGCAKLATALECPKCKLYVKHSSHSSDHSRMGSDQLTIHDTLVLILQGSKPAFAIFLFAGLLQEGLGRSQNLVPQQYSSTQN